jgi:hopanoid biosynthesis associated radical SAM protein HpnH
MVPIPVSQMWTVASYVVKQKLKGRKQYPLVLMLEPLYRCNLACAGCGKIQYPGHILKQNLSPEDCFRAVEETGVPTVAIPGGEPLMHPQIDEIVAGLVARRKYVYMCTNALLLKENLHRFTPSKYLTFSVHMDGDKEHHDFSVCKEGGYEIALEAIRAAVAKGFRVTTNTTLFDGADLKSVRRFFDQMMDSGVEGMMISPGYSYDKAPDQQHFTGRERNQQMFRKLLSNRSPKWRFNMSALFLEFLMGKRHFECTPWGMPAYSIFGWQRPCYLQQDGYTDTYQELLDSTDWSQYGFESGNSKCANCMLHSGYEASAVHFTFTLPGIVATVKSMLAPLYRDTEAQRLLDQDQPVSPLVQIDLNALAKTETLQGKKAAAHDLHSSLEEAFDYRGDVTVRLSSGQILEGYVYDRQGAPQSGQAKLRLMLKSEPGKKITIHQSEIEELSFSGRDMADGKSFEAWVRKYAQKKAAGETNIELVPEELDA